MKSNSQSSLSRQNNNFHQDQEDQQTAPNTGNGGFFSQRAGQSIQEGLIQSTQFSFSYQTERRSEDVSTQGQNNIYVRGDQETQESNQERSRQISLSSEEEAEEEKIIHPELRYVEISYYDASSAPSEESVSYNQRRNPPPYHNGFQASIPLNSLNYLNDDFQQEDEFAFGYYVEDEEIEQPQLERQNVLTPSSLENYYQRTESRVFTQDEHENEEEEEKQVQLSYLQSFNSNNSQLNNQEGSEISNQPQGDNLSLDQAEITITLIAYDDSSYYPFNSEFKQEPLTFHLFDQLSLTKSLTTSFYSLDEINRKDVVSPLSNQMVSSDQIAIAQTNLSSLIQTRRLTSEPTQANLTPENHRDNERPNFGESLFSSRRAEGDLQNRVNHLQNSQNSLDVDYSIPQQSQHISQPQENVSRSTSQFEVSVNSSLFNDQSVQIHSGQQQPGISTNIFRAEYDESITILDCKDSSYSTYEIGGNQLHDAYHNQFDYLKESDERAMIDECFDQSFVQESYDNNQYHGQLHQLFRRSPIDYEQQLQQQFNPALQGATRNQFNHAICSNQQNNQNRNISQTN